MEDIKRFMDGAKNNEPTTVDDLAAKQTLNSVFGRGRASTKIFGQTDAKPKKKEKKVDTEVKKPAKKAKKKAKPGRVSCKNCIYFREYSFDYKEMSQIYPNDGWCRKRCKMKQLADSCKCFTPNKADE